MDLKHLFIKVKMIIFLFIILEIFSGEVINITLAMLLLSYLITIFLKGILKDKGKIIVSVVEGLISAVISIKYIPLAIILSQLSILELLIGKLNSFAICLISAVPFVILRSFTFSSEVVAIVILIIFFFTFYYNEKLNYLKVEEDYNLKRKEICSLQNKLKDEQDFMEQFLYTTKLEERNKISGKLHDKIGHTISGTLLQLEATKVVLKNNFEEGIKLLDRSINNLRSGMDDIRMTLRDIRPQQEELGLNRIKLILDQKLNNTNFKYRILHKGDIEKISTTNWILFVQAIKELSTNSIKYSKGDLIKIDITILNRMIKFEFKDNGVGNININKGIGLINLEEKVAEVGGKLIITGESGFSVIILIPFK